MNSNRIIKYFSTSLFKNKKNVFEQTGFNPYHIYPWRYNKRKTQEELENYDIKKYYIPPACKDDGDHLINNIESEQMRNLKSQVAKRKEPVALGDTIEVEYYHSITNQKLYKYKGVVLGFTRRNSFTHTFKFLTIIGGEYVILNYPYFSPMLHSIKVLNKGNRGFKTKIYHYHKVNQMGLKLGEMLKGGKNIFVNKKRRIQLRKEERMKESVITE
jgi:ribosomal protein L19